MATKKPYDPEKQYNAAFKEKVQWRRVTFVPGKTYEVRGDVLNMHEDKVLAAAEIATKVGA